jgi:hypothetical protein
VCSTPRNPFNHARALRRVVDNCTTQQVMDGTSAPRLKE